MTTTQILVSIVISLMGVINAWFWYDKKNTDKEIKDLQNKVDAMDKQQAVHSNQFVTDNHVREIVREEVRDLKEDITLVKSTMTEIKDLTQTLIADIKVLNVVQNLQDQYKRDK